MNNKNKGISYGWLAVIIITAAVVIDQIIKIWVKTSFMLGEDVQITNWFHLVFVENKGMAYGFEIGSKFFLTWFRIIAVGLLIYYIVKLSKRRNVPTGYFVCISLITAGALGNVIDCIAYGLIFSESTFTSVAQMFPADGGYTSIFDGRVVDMFYFPLWTWPDWMPLVGGDIFFQPVFNFADACLTTSVAVLIIFYAKYLVQDDDKANKKEEKKPETEEKEFDDEAFRSKD